MIFGVTAPSESTSAPGSAMFPDPSNSTQDRKSIISRYNVREQPLTVGNHIVYSLRGGGKLKYPSRSDYIDSKGNLWARLEVKMGKYSDKDFVVW